MDIFKLFKIMSVGNNNFYALILPPLFILALFIASIYGVFESTGMFADRSDYFTIKESIEEYPSKVESFPIFTLQEYNDGKAEKSIIVRAYDRSAQMVRTKFVLLFINFALLAFGFSFWVTALALYFILGNNKYLPILNCFYNVIIILASFLILSHRVWKYIN